MFSDATDLLRTQSLSTTGVGVSYRHDTSQQSQPSRGRPETKASTLALKRISRRDFDDMFSPSRIDKPRQTDAVVSHGDSSSDEEEHLTFTIRGSRPRPSQRPASLPPEALKRMERREMESVLLAAPSRRHEPYKSEQEQRLEEMKDGFEDFVARGQFYISSIPLPVQEKIDLFFQPQSIDLLSDNDCYEMLQSLAQRASTFKAPCKKQIKKLLPLLLKKSFAPFPVYWVDRSVCVGSVSVTPGPSIGSKDTPLYALDIADIGRAARTGRFDKVGGSMISMLYLPSHAHLLVAKQHATPLTDIFVEKSLEERLFECKKRFSRQKDALIDQTRDFFAAEILSGLSRPQGILFEDGKLFFLHEAGHGTLSHLLPVFKHFSKSERLSMVAHIGYSVTHQLSVLQNGSDNFSDDFGNQPYVPYAVMRPETLCWDAKGQIGLSYANTPAVLASEAESASSSSAKHTAPNWFQALDTDERADSLFFSPPERLAQDSVTRAAAPAGTDIHLPPRVVSSPNAGDDLWALGMVLRRLWLAGAGVSSVLVGPESPIFRRAHHLNNYADWHARVGLEECGDLSTNDPLRFRSIWEPFTKELDAMICEHGPMGRLMHNRLGHPFPKHRSDVGLISDEFARLLGRATRTSQASSSQTGSLQLGACSSAAEALTGSNGRRPLPRAMRSHRRVSDLFEQASRMTDPHKELKRLLRAVAEG